MSNEVNNIFINFPKCEIGVRCKVYLVAVSNSGEESDIIFNGMHGVKACVNIGECESLLPSWNCAYQDFTSDGRGFFLMMTRLHSDCDIKILTI